MLSIGGITYTNDWDTALATNPAQLARNAAARRAAARRRHRDRLRELQLAESHRPADVHRHLPVAPALRRHRCEPGRPADHRPGRRRSVADRADPEGDRRLADARRYAGSRLRQRDGPVASSRPRRRAESNWQEHLTGKTNYNPPIPPLAPAKFTGSLYIAEGSKVRPECNNFSTSAAELHRQPGFRPRHRPAPEPPRDARLHVLGGREAVHPGSDHCPAQHLRGRRRRRRDDLSGPDPDAGTSPELTAEWRWSRTSPTTAITLNVTTKACLRSRPDSHSRWSLI